MKAAVSILALIASTALSLTILVVAVLAVAAGERCGA